MLYMDDSTRVNLLEDYNLKNLKIDDIYNVYDKLMLIRVSFRIKMLDKSGINVMFITINIIEKMTNNEYSNKFSRLYIQKYKMEYYKSITIGAQNLISRGSLIQTCTESEEACKREFINLIQFKNIFNKNIQHSDPILDNNFLEGEKKDRISTLEISYSFKKYETKDNDEDLQEQTFDCTKHCGVGNTCTFSQDSNNLLNVECTCPEGFLGLGCKNKLSCINCSPNFCKKGNVCEKCKIGWKGQNCLKKDIEALIDLCKNTTKCKKNGNLNTNCICSRNTDKINATVELDQIKPPETNIRVAKIEFVLGVTVGSVVLSAILIATIIFLFKKK